MGPRSRSSVAELKLAPGSRDGDRTSFGILYLTYHDVAWRMACAITAFLADPEIAVVEGFRAGGDVTLW